MQLTKFMLVVLVFGFASYVGVGTNQVMAEMYIGGQAGVTLPEELTDIKGTNGISGTTLSDVELKDALLTGFKIGRYFSGSVDWLGLEGEVYYSNPDIKRQTVTGNVSILGGTGATFTIPKTELHIVTFNFNVVVRYPGDMIQPYGGVGIGANIAYLRKGNVRSDAGFSPSLNLMGGLRAFVADRIALFAEYKYNHGTFEFYTNNFKADYRTNIIVGGLTYHFK